ncbi:hypothetical protein CBL_01744 [Carabus blaptoides fortunei]
MTHVLVQYIEDSEVQVVRVQNIKSIHSRSCLAKYYDGKLYEGKILKYRGTEAEPVAEILHQDSYQNEPVPKILHQDSCENESPVAEILHQDSYQDGYENEPPVAEILHQDSYENEPPVAEILHQDSYQESYENEPVVQISHQDGYENDPLAEILHQDSYENEPPVAEILHQKRAGEIERLLISDYCKRQSIDKGKHDDLYNSLSKLEQLLAERFIKVELRGKLGRSVPILLSGQQFSITLTEIEILGCSSQNAVDDAAPGKLHDDNIVNNKTPTKSNTRLGEIIDEFCMLLVSLGAQQASCSSTGTRSYREKIEKSDYF